MTAPGTCVVRRGRLDGAGPYPLATRSGIQQLSDMVAAYAYWKALTARGRRALSAAYRDALKGAKPGDVVPLPAAPADVHPLTLAALERRGMVAEGKLTPFAVEVVRLAEPIEKPTVTATLTGDHL